MSSMPPTTALVAAFAPVERDEENLVFAFGLADVVEEETVEDEIVDPDIVDDSVIDVASLLDEVEDTPANCFVSILLFTDAR
jgi:hypothetical protein